MKAKFEMNFQKWSKAICAWVGDIKCKICKKKKPSVSTYIKYNKACTIKLKWFLITILPVKTSKKALKKKTLISFLFFTIQFETNFILMAFP